MSGLPNLGSGASDRPYFHIKRFKASPFLLRTFCLCCTVFEIHACLEAVLYFWNRSHAFIFVFFGFIWLHHNVLDVLNVLPISYLPISSNFNAILSSDGCMTLGVLSSTNRTTLSQWSELATHWSMQQANWSRSNPPSACARSKRIVI